MIDVLESEYVQMARLKGVRERTVIRRHALRNSVVPIIQGSALAMIYLTGGIVTIEYLFAYPGLGSALAAGVQSRDLPLVRRSCCSSRPATCSSTCSRTCSRSWSRRGCGRGSGGERRPPGAAAVALAGRRARPALGPTRLGIAIAAVVVVVAAIGPFVAPHDPAALVGIPLQRPSPSSRSAPTTSVTTCSRGCSGAVAASSGWRSRRPRSGVVSVPRRHARGVLALAPRRLADARNGRHPGLPADRARAALRLDAGLESRAHRRARRALVGAPGRARRARRDRGHRPPRVRQAAEAIGLPRRRILVREILPNVTTPLLVEYGLRLTWSIAVIAAISFLGFGIQPPNADWGLMINENRNGIDAPALGGRRARDLHRGLRDRDELRRRGHLAGGRPASSGGERRVSGPARRGPARRVDRRRRHRRRDRASRSRPARSLGLVGESGSGKTTVALALLGHAKRGTRIAAARSRSAASKCSALGRASSRACARQARRVRAAGPARGAQPRAQHRHATRGGDRRSTASRPSRERVLARRSPRCAFPRARVPAPLPAPALGRPAAARLHRDGVPAAARG